MDIHILDLCAESEKWYEYAKTRDKSNFVLIMTPSDWLELSFRAFKKGENPPTERMCKECVSRL